MTEEIKKPPQAITLIDVAAEVTRARAKFPSSRFLLTALMEEVGELAKAPRSIRITPRSASLGRRLAGPGHDSEKAHPALRPSPARMEGRHRAPCRLKWGSRGCSPSSRSVICPWT